MLTMAREYDYSVQLFDDPECEDWPLDRMPMRRAIRITRDIYYLLGNGALLAPCRRWIGKCKWARPQNEQHQLVLRLIVTRILSACAARRFFGNTNPCTMEIAQLAFGKNHIVSPQTLRGRAKTQPPRATPVTVFEAPFTGPLT